MDQVRIGRFIAQLRREKGWTQEELGERVGVTNKTVSRWENGNYMPSIELLTLMGREFDVSLNELVEGRRLEQGDEFRAAADQNLAAAMKRPWERVREWLERYGGFLAVMAVLVLMLIGVTVGTVQYRQAHPGDVTPVGSYRWEYAGFPGDGEYIVLMGGGTPFASSTYGEYYRYRQFEPMEHGTWQADGELVTVAAGERSFQMLIKEDRLYAPDGEGRLTAYRKVADHGIFVNLGTEDFQG